MACLEALACATSRALSLPVFRHLNIIDDVATAQSSSAWGESLAQEASHLSIARSPEVNGYNFAMHSRSACLMKLLSNGRAFRHVGDCLATIFDKCISVGLETQDACFA